MEHAFSFTQFLKRSCLLTLMYLHVYIFSMAQEIPIGTWRTHVSYESIHSVVVSTEVIYAASLQGVLRFDREDNSLQSFTKLNGLTGSAISAIAFDQTMKALFIAYEEGTFDRIENNAITSFDPFQSTTITTSKRINQITLHNGLAYLSTDYGVLVFDLIRKEIKETWRDLGGGGETLSIAQSTFKGDSIFLATADGILAGDLTDNLLDFTKWKRFNSGDFAGNISSITTANNTVFAAVNGFGIYAYAEGSWQKQTYLQATSFRWLSTDGNNLFIPTADDIWKVDATNTPVALPGNLFSEPNQVAIDGNGKYWVADLAKGLLSDYTGTFQSIIANGPSSSSTFKLKFTNGQLFRLNGGYTASLSKQNKVGNIDEFSLGIWSTRTTDLTDIVDTEITNNVQYTAGFGVGLEVRDGAGNTILYNEGNSSMPNRNITAIEKSFSGVVVATYGATQSLHVLKPDNTWQGYNALITAGRYPLDMIEDFLGRIWVIVNPAQGGGVYVADLDDNAYAYKNATAGTGGLPNKNVRSLAMDRDGLVWVGTDNGAAYFYSANNDAVKPLLESRFLLRDDKVTAIAIDGGNRKWMGTERGAWLINAIGEGAIYHFTKENSPLLSNNILDIEINGTTGEVFFVTDAGISSFRADASESTYTFDEIKIFPNPVTEQYNGTIGISGLATDAIVKITDISGKLIWEGNANGGTATWNARDYTGRNVSTGVYLVLAALPDGSESIAGKIVVVR